MRCLPLSSLVALLGIAALGSPGGPAAAQDRSADAFLRCTAETDETERLACFDRVAREQAPESPGEAAADAVPPPVSPADAEAPADIAPATAPVPDAPAPAAAMTAAPAAAAAKPVEAPAPKAPPAKVTASTPQPAASPDPAPPVEVGPEPPEEELVGPPQEAAGDFTAVVRRVARQPRGEHVVYLENGQVWAENFANSYFPVEVGDTVTLRKRRFGGYRLITVSGRAVEVKRLR